MAVPESKLRTFAQGYLDTHTIEPPLGKILEQLAGGRLDRQSYLASIQEHVDSGGEPPNEAFSTAVSYIILDYLEYCLDDGHLTQGELADVVFLRRMFMLPESALAAIARDRVRDLLEKEMRAVFSDGLVEGSEALYKVGLQEALGLGYDDFQELASDSINEALRTVIAAADVDGNGELDASEMATLQRRILDLDLALNLNLHPLTPGAPTAGYVYAMMNPAMPGLVKIGMTSRAPDERALELGSTTGVPAPFQMLFDIYVPDRKDAEAWVHEQLEARGSRASESREFFHISPREAVEVLLQAKTIFGGWGAP